MSKEPARKWRYHLDNLLEKGSGVLIIALGVGTLTFVFMIALIQHMLISDDRSLLGKFFSGVLWTVAVDRDPTMDDTLFIQKITGGLFLLTGLLSVGVLIGVLTTGLSDRLEELRQGRSPVVETEHTVLLGWSAQAISIVEQLIIANESESRACVVILADRSKGDMDDEIRSQLPDTKTTRVVTRRGDPMDMNDLSLAAIKGAKSIVIASPDAEDPDADVIKILLAIVNDPERRWNPYHIVAEVHDPKNAEVCEIVGGDEVEFVLTNDFLARLTAQTSRKSGLSAVYSEILDFDGNEIYFHSSEELTGRTFGEAIFAFSDAIPIGIQRGEETPLLNPTDDFIIEQDDKMIVLAEDDSEIHIEGDGREHIMEKGVKATDDVEDEPERLMIVGWNRRAPLIIEQLDRFVPEGSQVDVFADLPDEPLNLNRFERLTVVVKLGDTTDRRMLEELDMEHLDRVILLSYSERLDAQRADARTLISLMHLRDIARKADKELRISTEMMDVRNRRLAEVTAADDFVVSDRLISLTLAQISETKALADVYSELFDAEGSEIYLRPCSFYVEPGKLVNFATVSAAARKRHEIALGWRRLDDVRPDHPRHGVSLNPGHTNLTRLSEGDRVVVLAEE